LIAATDVRMIVADGRAHLAGREVQNSLPGCVPHVAALRLLDDFRIDIATVTDQMLAEIGNLLSSCTLIISSLPSWTVHAAARHLDDTHRMAGRCKEALELRVPDHQSWRRFTSGCA